MTINNDLISAILIALIGFLGAILGGRYATRSEKQTTSRLVFEKSYEKIFSLIEDDFYNKQLTNEQISAYGKSIYEILDSSDGYYYPSLKQYASWMFDPNYKGNLQDLWHSFSWTFDRQYEKTTNEIGLPKRSRYYRFNKHQYSDKFHYFRIYLTSNYVYVDILFIVMIFLAFFIINTLK